MQEKLARPEWFGQANDPSTRNNIYTKSSLHLDFLEQRPLYRMREQQRWSILWFVNNKACRNTNRMQGRHQCPHVHMGVEGGGGGGKQSQFSCRWKRLGETTGHCSTTHQTLKHQDTTKDQQENDKSTNKLKYLVCYHKIGQNALKFFFRDAFVLRTQKNSMISTHQHVTLFSRKEIVLKFSELRRFLFFSSPGLVGCRPFFWLLPPTTDVIFRILQKFSKFGQHLPVMTNQPLDLSQSETEKCFE